VRTLLVGVGLAALGIVGAASIAAPTALAYRDGINGADCSGCHAVGSQTAELATVPATFEPGAVVAFTVRVGSSSSAVAGVNVQVDTGTLRPVAGGGLHLVGLELTHDLPVPFSSGVAEFRGQWVAPDEPGATRFVISSVASNGDGRRNAGDGAALHEFDHVYGCESTTFYRDRDGDEHGDPSRTRTACTGAPPKRYVASNDDCDDSRLTTYAGAEELCNRRDDDCDTGVDENIEPVTHYPDADGDGYYSRDEHSSGETIFGCPEGGRWASLSGDCAPDDSEINPGAPEVCNLLDDNCDGRRDERVRPQCGIGWCRRDARSCDAEDCEPGPPEVETCNMLDDDCDGPVDEGVCPDGQVCMRYECVPASMGDAAVDGASRSDGTTASAGCSAADHVPGSWVWLVMSCLLTCTRRTRLRVRGSRARPRSDDRCGRLCR